MNKIRLRDDVIINMLYGQFKNQALSINERFQYAKLLIEQALSCVVSYPDNDVIGYLDLNVIVQNKRYRDYFIKIYAHFDFESIELLNNKLHHTHELIEDNKVLQRLASLFYMIMNDELQVIKKKADTSWENQIKAEIKSILEQWDSFIDNEDKLAQIEYEISELEEMYSFSQSDEQLQNINSLKDVRTDLQTKDLQTNQNKLDALALRLSQSKDIAFSSATHKTDIPHKVENNENKLDSKNLVFSQAGKPWSTEQDNLLKSYFYEGKSISYISNLMGRTYGSIRSRLVRNGLIEN